MRVWVLEYSHKHGTDLTAYATPQAAEAGAAEIARQWWASEMRGEAGVPESPAEPERRRGRRDVLRSHQRDTRDSRPAGLSVTPAGVLVY